jgi:hypothetical protein
MRLVPIGVHADTREVVSTGPVALKRLDYLGYSLDVTVNILNPGGDVRRELIGKTRLSPGPSVFIVDFADVQSAGFDTGINKKFLVEILARAVDGSRTQRIQIPGTLDERTEGKVLGQIMVHDVLIQDGSLNLGNFGDGEFWGRPLIYW